MALLDYRDLPETEPFDKTASVGMCEHVGRALMPADFAKIHRVLAPGGLPIYRLCLAGSAMGFEQGWTALFQRLASRPSGHVGEGPMPGAQSPFPFNRGYLCTP